MTVDDVVRVLRLGVDICVVVTADEDKAINKAGYRNKMPKGWKPGDDPYDRYLSAGLDPDEFGPATT